MKIKISDIEQKLNYKIKRNFKSIGFDTATTSGICFLKTDNEYLYIDVLILSFKTENQKEKYNTIVKTMERLIDDNSYLIVENVFLGVNPDSTIELSRFGGFAISCAIRKDLNYETILATSARSKFGIKTKGYGAGNSKLAVKDWINSIGVDITDNNAADAFVLALLGICEGMDFRTQAAIKKSKTKKKATKRK